MITSDVLGSRMALVVIDAQRKFRSDRPDWEAARSAATERMNRLLFMFRSAGAPVISVVYDGEAPCRPYEGDDGDEYLPGLAIRSDDITVRKSRMSAFDGTELADILGRCGCDMVLLCGMVTQYCVMSTYFAAMDRSIVPYIAHGATVGTSDEMVAAAETVCKTMTEETVSAVLGCAVPEEGVAPVFVSNVLESWDDSRLCDIAALANSGGGHFVVGYPKGPRDPEGLARMIRARSLEALGVRVDAEVITFCCNRSVEVNVERSESPVVFGGQRFSAVRDYSYRSPDARTERASDGEGWEEKNRW